MKQNYFLRLLFLSTIINAQITEISDINITGDSDPDSFFVDSSDRLFFQADNGVDGNELFVYNGTIDNNTINHNLSTGLYLLRLDNGSNSAAKKIIVKHFF